MNAIDGRDQKFERINDAIWRVVKPLWQQSMVMSLFKRHLSCGGRQATETQQVVGGTDQMGVQLHASNAAHVHAAQASIGFHPPEDLLDPLALALTGPVAGVPGGTRIESGRLAALDLRDVRRNALAAQERHKVFGVIALVGTERAGSQAFASQAIEQVCESALRID
jgi:hypothetical protein